MRIVRGGSIVTEGGVVDGDVAVSGGVIAGIGHRLDGDLLLDASDCWVLPGAIDPHIHVSLEGYSTMEPILDDAVDASASGLMGGVTTLGVFVQRTPVKDIVGVMRGLIDYGNAEAHSDFFMNGLLLPGDDVEGAIRAGADIGVMSYKAMVAYNKKGLMFDDEHLMRLMATVADVGGLTMIHAENGGGIDYLESVERMRGVDNGSLLRAQPGAFEAEGMFRAATFARITGTRLLFVHLSSKEGAAMLRQLKEGPYGARIDSETQPHYLALTNAEVLTRGPLGKVGPPLKEEEDVAAVWAVTENGLLSHISSDHSPKSTAVKLATDDILDATYGGIGGVEPMLPLVYSLGFEAGRISIEDVARLTATGAAKVHNIYPKKGTIRVGSDADLAVIPKQAPPKRIVPENLHGKADYSLYESLSSSGFPRDVVRRGVVAVRDGSVTGDNSTGGYIGSAPRD
ncbi:MAG: amidohydrolase family protein [bacterium]|nr:amidohydrolase family protein [bacterium]